MRVANPARTTPSRIADSGHRSLTLKTYGALSRALRYRAAGPRKSGGDSTRIRSGGSICRGPIAAAAIANERVREESLREPALRRQERHPDRPDPTDEFNRCPEGIVSVEDLPSRVIREGGQCLHGPTAVDQAFTELGEASLRRAHFRRPVLAQDQQVWSAHVASRPRAEALISVRRRWSPTGPGTRARPSSAPRWPASRPRARHSGRRNGTSRSLRRG